MRVFLCSHLTPSSLCLPLSSWLLLCDVFSIMSSQSGSPNLCHLLREQSASKNEEKYCSIFLLESSLAPAPASSHLAVQPIPLCSKGNTSETELRNLAGGFVAKGSDSCRHDRILTKDGGQNKSPNAARGAVI